MAKKKSTKTTKSKIYFTATRLVIFLVLLTVIVSGGLLFKDQLYTLINGKNNVNSEIDYDGLLVHYLEVGQADCMFIELPDGKNMLIDAGTKSKGDYIVEYINDIFNRRENKTIDYLLLTHSHDDHYGGMIKILDAFEVETIFRPCDNRSDQGYTNVLNRFNEETENVFIINVEDMNGRYKIEGGESANYYSFSFYTPLLTSYTNPNNYSPIFKLTYRNKNFMFTGDAETINENEFLNNYTFNERIDVLKVGHHGSNTSSSQAFLEKLQPRYAIITCKESNTTPSQKTLNRLASVSANILRTNENHDIIANVNLSGELNIVCLNFTYQGIKVEYVMIFALLISAYFCFFIKYKNN